MNMKLARLLPFALALPLAAQTISLFPPQVSLSSAESRQQLLAEAAAGTYQEDWTRKVTWTSSNPSVAKVDGTGLVLPVSDGDAVITAERNGQKATARISVKNSKAPFEWSF